MEETRPSVLFIFTSTSAHLELEGYSVPSAAHAYYVLRRACDIDFASPRGPHITPSGRSQVVSDHDTESKLFLQDEEVQLKFDNAQRLADVDPERYDALFYVGGQGATIDLPEDAVNIKLASQAYQSGKVLAAICHGVACLLNVQASKVTSIFSGKHSTGISNIEEDYVIIGTDVVSFGLQDRIQRLGGIYHKSDEVWKPKVVVDGRLYTAQNPGSARLLASQLLGGLKYLPREPGIVIDGQMFRGPTETAVKPIATDIPKALLRQLGFAF